MKMTKQIIHGKTRNSRTYLQIMVITREAEVDPKDYHTSKFRSLYKEIEKTKLFNRVSK